MYPSWYCCSSSTFAGECFLELHCKCGYITNARRYFKFEHNHAGWCPELDKLFTMIGI